MDKICHATGGGDSTTTSSNITTTTTNNRDHYLKHLNKLSHKISKPITKKHIFDQNLEHPLPVQSQPQHNNNQNLQPQQQPPVYNINKNDFRDVVQKLTGSPAHERFSTPPPIHPPKPPSSRLQRIRPPPLAHLSNRPPPLLNCSPPPPPPEQRIPQPPPTNPNFIQRSTTTPLSPLPPFPTVHAAAESPVSAYMRYLHDSIPTVDPNHKNQFTGFTPLSSSRWNNLTPPPPPPPPPQQYQQFAAPQQGTLPMPSQSQFQLPSSPLPFGCLNSPRSPYPLLSPSLLFSPTGSPFGFPLSPTVPLPSPKWRGI
ncbi:VQ domain-containing protein [Cephalotus follicularis]|uniref:VQ domain-containing protein n=1 Tax=Cephalotus follicularis TaxID=3775 RepID=A0A1Q3CSZ7_CEPFO|nr:VQ domain-containing protein [Cephalotus follicularis]